MNYFVVHPNENHVNLTKKVCFQAQAGAYFTSFTHVKLLITEFRGVKKGVELQQNSIKLFILNWMDVFYMDPVIIEI